MAKVCLGCFREWESDRPVCRHCGWKPGQEYGPVSEWTTGEIFGKRYMLGTMFCRTWDAAIWRIYDRFLEIPCLALRAMADESKERLCCMADSMAQLREITGSSVKIMGIRELGGKPALLFSAEDASGKQRIMQNLLNSSMNRQKSGAWTGEGDKKREPAGSSPPQALPEGTLLDGRYEVAGCIGIGGFGIVYRCRDIWLRRLVAVKEYFPAEWALREETYVTVKNSQMLEAYRFGLRSFYREARISAKFIHTSHLVTVYDVVEANDTAYMVMEYIDGISIGREMRAREYEPYDEKAMARIILPVAGALEALHMSRIVHSDVSPANIMRTAEGEIVLIDMGAAKYALSSQPTMSAAFLKPDYAAPEQYRSAKQMLPKDEGPWTDVYGLGATMYYLLAGQKPPDIMSRLEARKPEVSLPRKSGCRHRKKWDRLLNRAMALDIRERIPSAGELASEVQRLAE